MSIQGERELRRVNLSLLFALKLSRTFGTLVKSRVLLMTLVKSRALSATLVKSRALSATLVKSRVLSVTLVKSRALSCALVNFRAALSLTLNLFVSSFVPRSLRENSPANLNLYFRLLSFLSGPATLLQKVN